MLQLDFGDHRPLYEQIRDKMKDLIINGILADNDKIPSVRELASTLAINPNTIQKAYKELENEGYIYSLKARGNFVTPRKQTGSISKIRELSESVKPIIREMKFLGAKEEELHEIIKQIYEEEQR